MVPWVNLDYVLHSELHEKCFHPARNTTSSAEDDSSTEKQSSVHILAVVLTGEGASLIEEQSLEETKADIMQTLRDMYPAESIPGKQINRLIFFFFLHWGAIARE